MLQHPDTAAGLHAQTGIDIHHTECTTPTPHLRRLSDDSAKSNGSEVKLRTAHLVYDSGHYSTSSNASDISGGIDSDLQGHYERYQSALREKDQSLLLAMHDLRKLRSELERLSKSEQWYKQELRTQKNTRLEVLERLYTQERKYMQENQRLQRECMRLYENCREMEKGLNLQRDQAVQELANVTHQDQPVTLGSCGGVSFEIEQQRGLICDQQQLINVLRKQKRTLLDDFRRLTEEKDEKVLELQRTLASMELEANHVTAQCKRLFNEKQTLEETLQSKDVALNNENEEKFKLQEIICHLKADLQEQECLVAAKENEIIDLQNHFKVNMEMESNMDEVHRLSVTYHEDINAKTSEIIILKKSLKALEEELNSFAELQTRSEQQERLIENLNFTLDTLRYELDNLKEADVKKAQQITELQQNVEAIHYEHEETLERLLSSQTALKKLQKELIDLNEQYANMCALCERTRFELELREIDQGKLQFQAESDKRETTQLREKLKEYLMHIRDLSSKINKLEAELDCTLVEKEKLAVTFRTLQQHFERDGALKPATLNLVAEKNKFIRREKLKEQKQLEENEAEDVVDSKSDRESDPGSTEQCVKEMTTREAWPIYSVKEHFVEENDCIALTEQQNKLQSYLDNLHDANVEEETMLDAVNAMIDSEIKPKEQLNSLHIVLVNMKKLIGENRELKAQLNSAVQAQKILCEDKAECQELADLNNMQTIVISELVKIDDTNPMETDTQNQLEHYQMENIADHTDLRNKNDKLCKELEKLLDAKKNIEAELQQEQNKADELMSKLKSAEIFEPQELLKLRERVHELEDKLKVSVSANDERRDQRIALINKLLEEQNIKVNQLNASQAEWEDLLKVLNETQQLEESTRNELKVKHAELEELNALFAEQNEELCKLQQIALLANWKSDEDLVKVQYTFQEQVKELQKNLYDKMQENETQKSIIEDLKNKNEILEQASTIEQATIEQLKEERNSYANRVTEMETELTEIRKNKREGMLLPSDFTACSDNLTKTLKESMSSSNEGSNSDRTDTDDRLRILTKVLEGEFRRKIKRYDLHIHSLLNNIKGLKKALRCAEQRAANLTEEQKRTAADLRDFQLTKCHLKEMRLKLDHSERTVKALENALENERKQFEASDFGKSTNPRGQSEESVHEVANLIDDYKKLIQQSASTTHRPKTNIILDLIQRSNKFLPNLNKLESSVDGLRSDLDHFLRTYVHNTYDSSITHKLDAPSLLDELRAAAENF